MFKKLQSQLLLILILPLFLVLLIAFIMIFLLSKHNMHEASREKLQSIMTRPRGRIKGLNRGGRNEEYFSESFIVVLEGGEVIGAIARDAVDGELIERLLNKTVGEDYSVVKVDEGHYMFQRSFNRGKTHIAYLDVSEKKRDLDSLGKNLLIIFLISMTGLSILSYLYANHTTKPIEEAFLRQKRFVADASHELKTPLSIIKANAELIEGDDSHIGVILGETRRMNSLINSLLQLASSEEGFEIKREPFDLSEALANYIVSVEAVAFERGLKIESKIERDIVITEDREKTQKAISILFDNAMKYAPSQSIIEVSLAKRNKRAIFTISNLCDLDEKEFSQIFHRFYKADKSRSKERESYGLGLSILKSMSDNMKWDVDAKLWDKKIIFKLRFI